MLDDVFDIYRNDMSLLGSCDLMGQLQVERDVERIISETPLSTAATHIAPLISVSGTYASQSAA